MRDRISPHESTDCAAAFPCLAVASSEEESFSTRSWRDIIEPFERIRANPNISGFRRSLKYRQSLIAASERHGAKCARRNERVLILREGKNLFFADRNQPCRDEVLNRFEPTAGMPGFQHLPERSDGRRVAVEETCPPRKRTRRRQCRTNPDPRRGR